MPPLRCLSLLVLALALLPARPAGADDVDDGLKLFREAQRQEDWKARLEAYDALAFYDGPRIVNAMLDALEADPHPAVRLAGAERLGRLVSGDAKDELFAAVRKGSDVRRYLALIGVREQPGNDGKDLLLELAQGKDPLLVAQAVIAIGQKRFADAVPLLLDLLRAAPDWQVRRAAAEALRRLAGPPPETKIDRDGNPIEELNPPPWVPEWYPLDTVVPALIAALERKDGGVERGEAWRTLIRLLKHDMDFDPGAWRELAAGKAPEAIARKPLPYRTLFGVPLFGERMVVIVDNSNQTDDPHPYDRDRLTTLCEVPGARPIPWFQLATKRDFSHAWVRRWIQDLPKGARFDLFMVTTKVDEAHGKLAPVNTGSRKKALELLDEAKPVTGQDVLTAFQMAIDIGGDKDKQVWTKGPEEILYVASTVPWLATVTDQEHIGGAVALRAGWLQIPIHTVGVGNHPYEMMKRMSAAAGGRYVDLAK